jgi:2C-methyl-D-erythritol 2,4-cyclodiphosphate synthase
LSSPYAALREKAVEQLFETFSLMGGNDDEEDQERGDRINEALELLSQTDWTTGNARMELAMQRGKIAKLLLNIDETT